MLLWYYNIIAFNSGYLFIVLLQFRQQNTYVQYILL